MKKRMFAPVLAALLLLSMLSGCSLARKIDAAEDRFENKIDAVEDNIENRIDAVEDSIEQKVEPSVTVTVTPFSDQKLYASPTPDQITHADALEIALRHANLSEDEVQYIHTEYEIDDGIAQYDVQFYVDRWEYEYEINADTGDIISFDRDD